MNIFLWVLQILLALHTVMGAVWKFSNSETTASLKAIPHGIWMLLIVIEILCALALIIPSFIKNAGILAPIAAAVLATEMIFFCIMYFVSGGGTYSQPVYWLVVAVICAFLAYGRFVLKPL